MPRILRPHDHKGIHIKRAHEMLGNKYGKLTPTKVVVEEGYKANTVHLLCKCDCGGMKTVGIRNLERKCVKSCGCLKPGRKSFYEVPRGISVKNHCGHCKSEQEYLNNTCVTCGLKIPDKNYKTKQRNYRDH